MSLINNTKQERKDNLRFIGRNILGDMKRLKVGLDVNKLIKKRKFRKEEKKSEGKGNEEKER